MELAPKRVVAAERDDRIGNRFLDRLDVAGWPLIYCSDHRLPSPVKNSLPKARGLS